MAVPTRALPIPKLPTIGTIAGTGTTTITGTITMGTGTTTGTITMGTGMTTGTITGTITTT